MLKEKDNYSWYKYYNDMKTHIEYPNTSMYSLMRKCALKYPSNIAYTYFGNKVTYKSLISKIDEASRAFLRLGVNKKDVVSIIMPNTPEAIICFYALNRIGAVCNMIHPLSSEEEFKYDIKLANTKYVIVADIAYRVRDSVRIYGGVVQKRLVVKDAFRHERERGFDGRVGRHGGLQRTSGQNGEDALRASSVGHCRNRR